MSVEYFLKAPFSLLHKAKDKSYFHKFLIYPNPFFIVNFQFNLQLHYFKLYPHLSCILIDVWLHIYRKSDINLAIIYIIFHLILIYFLWPEARQSVQSNPECHISRDKLIKEIYFSFQIPILPLHNTKFLLYFFIKSSRSDYYAINQVNWVFFFSKDRNRSFQRRNDFHHYCFHYYKYYYYYFFSNFPIILNCAVSDCYNPNVFKNQEKYLPAKSN